MKNKIDIHNNPDRFLGTDRGNTILIDVDGESEPRKFGGLVYYESLSDFILFSENEDEIRNIPSTVNVFILSNVVPPIISKRDLLWENSKKVGAIELVVSEEENLFGFKQRFHASTFTRV